MHLQHYLLCYDIADKKRLAKVFGAVTKVMVQVQYSVYYAEVMPVAIERLVAQLRKLIDASQDDIRVYSIEPLANAICLGSIQSFKVCMFDSCGRPLS